MSEKIKKEIINGTEILSYESEEKTQNVDEVMEWIKNNVVYTKYINKKHSSYGIKHLIEKSIGKYVSNYDIKYCFAMIGVKGISDGVNYYYPISEKWYKQIEKEI